MPSNTSIAYYANTQCWRCLCQIQVGQLHTDQHGVQWCSQCNALPEDERWDTSSYRTQAEKIAEWKDGIHWKVNETSDALDDSIFFQDKDEGEQEQVWIQAVTELADGVEIDVDNNELSEFRTFLKNQFFEHCGNEAAYGHESREELYNVFKNW